MKTSVPMQREIGGIKFHQRTKDSYFDANELLAKWNKSTGKKRQMMDFLNSKQTLSFLDALEDEIAQSEKSDMAKTKALHIIKGKNTSKGKTNDQVWMHPYLFIDFAMWINPTFKLKVIKFVYDQLISERNFAGDNYKILSAAGVKLKGYDFAKVATAMQWIVFNRTGKGLRQTATESELQELNDIQTKLAFAIDMGYITSYNDLIKEMRKIWEKKYNSNPIMN